MWYTSQWRSTTTGPLRWAILIAGIGGAGLVTAADLRAQTPAPPAARPFSLGGDLRAGYFSLERRERSGALTHSDDFRARLRLRAGVRVGASWDGALRVAGRFSTEQAGTAFYVRDHAPTTDGLRLGEATIDEAYVRYRPTQRLSIRAGRLQTKFALADLQAKSLDRGDSPNTDITWTDGAHVTYAFDGGWRSHLVLQHNARAGGTNVLRSPLGFADSRSRVTLFGAVERAPAEGLIAQQGLDVTWIPRGLRVPGEPDDAAEDYVAIVGRGSLAWPIGGGSGRISLGGELGYAPNTPSLATLQLGEAGSGDAGGLGLQLGLSVMDPIPGHRAALVYGHTEAGWLIAPDFRNNDRLIEGRYQWAFTRNHSFEARLRHRTDLARPVAASQRRSDLDYYLRVSLRF